MLTRLFIFALLIADCKGWAQSFSENQFARYTVKEGLSNNYVTSIQQDEDGYIWVATDAGLNRFDGNSFSSYTYGNAKLPLLSGKISSIKYFNGNQLGVATRSGFQILNTKTFQLTNYVVPDTTSFTNYSNFVWDAQYINEEIIGLASASGFYSFNKKGELLYRKDAYSVKDVGKKLIRYARDIVKINDQDALIYLQGGQLAYFNNSTNNFKLIADNDPDWGLFKKPPGTNNYNWITKSKIGTDEYIFINYETNEIIYYHHRLKKQRSSLLPFKVTDILNYESRITTYNDSILLLNGGHSGFYTLLLHKTSKEISCEKGKHLPSVKVNSIYVDKEGRVWLSTPNGVLMQKIKPNFFSDNHYSSALLNDKEGSSFSACFPYRNKLYVTRYSGTIGLTVIDAASMNLEKSLSFFNGATRWNEILSVEMYHPDTLWLGTNAGIIWFDTKTHHYDSVLHLKHRFRETINAILLLPAFTDESAWFCYTLSGVIGKYNTNNRDFSFFTSTSVPPLPFTRIKHIVQDKSGNIWIAGNSLARFNNQTEQFDNYRSVYSGKKKFNDDILLIQSDPYGSLWLHTHENGLLEYNTKNHQFVSYSTANGLPAINFESLSAVTDSILWLAGDQNLTAFNTVTKQIKFYNYPPALTGLKPSGKVIRYNVSSGIFYLLVGNRIISFSPEKQLWVHPFNKLLIEEVTVNNKQYFIRPGNELTLNYQQNNIGIRFSIVDFEENNSYEFSFRLNNAEQWTTLQNQRNIVLTDLPHGAYNFQIKATRNGADTVTFLLIHITAPFWETTGFIILVALAVVAAVYWLFRNRVQKIKERSELDRKLIETEMKALQSQMNPHFIFNSLNSIKEMILNDKNAEASRYLSKFAHLMRLTLTHSEEVFISLTNTTQYLERYIEMERIRNEHFTYSLVTDEAIDADEVYLHPMLIQPLIENAIWHGTGEQHKNIHIKISFSLEDEKLVCSIDDDGVGINTASLQSTDLVSGCKSVGIQNIKNRIALLNEKYNLEGSLHITDKSTLQQYNENGTVAILKLSTKNLFHGKH